MDSVPESPLKHTDKKTSRGDRRAAARASRLCMDCGSSPVHIGKRNAAFKRCLVCHKAKRAAISKKRWREKGKPNYTPGKLAAYYQANKARILAQRKVYYAANRERACQKSKEWRQKNPKKMAAYCKAWGRTPAGKAYYKRYHREKDQANPDNARHRCVLRRARLRSATIGSIDAIKAFYKALHSDRIIHCYYCGKPTRKGKRVGDHIVAISRGGDHSAANLCCCCPKCNQAKFTNPPESITGQPLLL